MNMTGKKIAAKCEICGNVDSFQSGTENGVHICRQCGVFQFGEYGRRVYVNCECGGHTKYMTNAKDSMLDAKCWKCGAPVAVEWNQKKHVYQTVRE